MQQGAREFFETQGMDALAGADTLAGEFRALAAPAACREPARRETYNKRDGMHWICLPGNDFWMFDDRLVRFGYFSGDRVSSAKPLVVRFK